MEDGTDMLIDYCFVTEVYWFAGKKNPTRGRMWGPDVLSSRILKERIPSREDLTVRFVGLLGRAVYSDPITAIYVEAGRRIKLLDKQMEKAQKSQEGLSAEEKFCLETKRKKYVEVRERLEKECEDASLGIDLSRVRDD